MSTLFVVRHAQASFLSANYDKLSSLGETQATLLGGHWVNNELAFDEVYMGPRDRQQRTAALVERVYRDAGLDFPKPVLAPELDEYQGEQLLKSALPSIMSEDVHLQTLAATYAESNQEDSRSRMKHFQKMFEHVMRRWVRGEIGGEGVEPWADFKSRVGGFVKSVQALPGKGRRVAFFTSGGTVSAVVQRALNLGDEETVEMSWMVKNCAVSELAFNAEKLTLGEFNSTPHLQTGKLITYR